MNILSTAAVGALICFSISTVYAQTKTGSPPTTRPHAEVSKTTNQETKQNVPASPAIRRVIPPHFGIGINLGEPTGLIAHVPVSQTWRMHVGFGYSFKKRVQFNPDFVYYINAVQALDPEQTSVWWFYLGLGPTLLLSTEEKFRSANGQVSDPATSFGIRVPIGAEWYFLGHGMSVLAEFAPGAEVAPSSKKLYNGALGVRFYNWGKPK